ncbi:methylated-DNA--[protein]-cysteine S-methyltransferase [Streptomyces sp. SID2888]|uniref:methylated-DNA--[protein]-cysteine S-methyltransferase n=1 Tax=Streptomyces sp. SID2888 TaxID=2690256 RepID=UPI00136CEAF4|nr:methylated-DNA--[protein]-cysteine S-methyltransferase [Streptomyces sp. SID2888]MYV47993.1 methylated-DNA--[protein]-cysteine S-methyltransferase [Streptomyces sp. SID2888]
MNAKYAVVTTSLGPVTIVASDDAVTGLYFAHHVRRPAQETFGTELPLEMDTLLAEAAAQLNDYLAGRRRDFDLPFEAAGNDFQHRVWAAMAAIPFGETTTYGAIAEQLGDKSLAYEVGQAVGANPLCVFVPCHRVVGANGSLTGYAGGLKCKRALLDLEEPVQAAAGRLF